jgi:hypothetical protein
MANWSETTKHSPSDINGGNKYEVKDRVSREQLNAITENSLFAVKKSEEALDKANSAFEGNGTLVTINGVPQPTWSADFVERTTNKTTSQSAFITNRNSYDKYPCNENVNDMNRGLIKPNDNSTSIDEFLDFVQNTLEYGLYKFYKNFGGNFQGFIVFKVSNSYSTVIRIQYSTTIPISVNVLSAGIWSGWGDVMLS